MISKELMSNILSDIQGMDVKEVIEVYKSDNEVYYIASVLNINTKEYTTIRRYFNIYELAHTCKEWAFKKGYELSSRLDKQAIATAILWLDFAECTVQNQNTEPDAIFKVCQWILDTESKS